MYWNLKSGSGGLLLLLVVVVWFCCWVFREGKGEGRRGKCMSSKALVSWWHILALGTPSPPCCYHPFSYSSIRQSHSLFFLATTASGRDMAYKSLFGTSLIDMPRDLLRCFFNFITINVFSSESSSMRKNATMPYKWMYACCMNTSSILFEVFSL